VRYSGFVFLICSMMTIFVDAYHIFVLPDVGVFWDMRELLDGYLNRKVVLTNADDKEITRFRMVDLPYDVFSLKPVMFCILSMMRGFLRALGLLGSRLIL